jgi:amino acid adenylation domain-containing protein
MGHIQSSIQGGLCPSKALPEAIQQQHHSSNRSGSSHRSVAEWFRVQASKTPWQVALAQGSDRLTYSELELRSNQFAHWLRANGVQGETVVALRMSGSPAFVAAALGIWKAGGAYLPLDPDLPPHRISFILDDARVPILLTERKLSSIPSEGERRVLLLDRESQILDSMPTNAPEEVEGADNLAYVIYTSGSSGAPKGAEITHRNLLNLIAWHREAFRISGKDRATQLANLGFDAAVWEIWPYLTAGASVHFVPDTIRSVPDQLRDWLVENIITIGFVPTALAELLLNLDWPAKTALRLMLTGADTLHQYPSPGLPFQLVNNYGPTECSVVTTSGIVAPLEHPDMLPSIGRPIPNSQIYILDENMRPVTGGRPGELFIGGAGVARGYRNRPDLTAERFIANPFTNGNGDRLYRTGDLVRMLPDGQLSFLGRTDEQIKISGYRIEPNEIVRALGEHDAIQTSCVIAREDIAGDKRLVAYVVVKPGAKVTGTELRSLLQGLPAYMMPAEFVALDKLPLTSNGKVDRAALPIPESANVLRDTAAVAPRSPMERRITEILSKLLGLDQVGVEDNFFMLGGHSLLGTQLIGRVRDAFGVELSLRTVFEASTIAQLSTEIEKLLLAKLDAMSEEEAQQLLNTAEQSRPLEEES